MNRMAFYRSIACVALVWSAGAVSAAPHVDTLRSSGVRYIRDADGPKAHFPDGREYRLLPVPAADPAPAKSAAPARSHSATIQSSLPNQVDHRQFYDSIRDQGDRGTCVSFATVAAVEGVYRRVDPQRYARLHLSEQWTNHMLKMVDRRQTSRADVMEDNFGSWGISRISYALFTLGRYGVPEAALMEYNPTAAYEAIGEQYEGRDEQGQPNGYAAANAPQLAADDFNLDPERLPVTALEKAPYRPLRGAFLSQAEMQDPSLLEQILAAGYDVPFGMTLVDDLRNADGAWVPAANGQSHGGHVMLIVGYNHERQYFVVRNQWGPDPDSIRAGDRDGYARISYDYIRQYATDGAYVTTVSDPDQPQSRERLWLRRWSVNDTSGNGAGYFDFYRLPGTIARQDPRTDDSRIGTYFDPQGNAYRVNGQMDGDRLTIYLNAQDPNADPADLSGTRIQLELTPDGMGWQVLRSAG